MPAGRPSTQHTLHRQPRLNLVACVDRAYRQPTNVQPAVGADSALPDSPAGGEGACCPSLVPKYPTLALGLWPQFFGLSVVAPQLKMLGSPLPQFQKVLSWKTCGGPVIQDELLSIVLVRASNRGSAAECCTCSVCPLSDSVSASEHFHSYIKNFVMKARRLLFCP